MLNEVDILSVRDFIIIISVLYYFFCCAPFLAFFFFFLLHINDFRVYYSQIKSPLFI